MNHAVVIKYRGAIVSVGTAITYSAALVMKREAESEISHVPDINFSVEVHPIEIAVCGDHLARLAFEKVDI